MCYKNTLKKKRSQSCVRPRQRYATQIQINMEQIQGGRNKPQRDNNNRDK